MSAKQADEEPYEEATIHLKILSLIHERQEKDAKDQERRARR